MGILLLYVIHTIDASECQKPKKTLISIISMKICLLFIVFCSGNLSSCGKTI